MADVHITQSSIRIVSVVPIGFFIVVIPISVQILSNIEQKDLEWSVVFFEIGILSKEHGAACRACVGCFEPGEEASAAIDIPAARDSQRCAVDGIGSGLALRHCCGSGLVLSCVWSRGLA
jgi:hypothetical protein